MKSWSKSRSNIEFIPIEQIRRKLSRQILPEITDRSNCKSPGFTNAISTPTSSICASIANWIARSDLEHDVPPPQSLAISESDRVA
jgi:hypothetical protein